MISPRPWNIDTLTDPGIPVIGTGRRVNKIYAYGLVGAGLALWDIDKQGIVLRGTATTLDGALAALRAIDALQSRRGA